MNDNPLIAQAEPDTTAVTGVGFLESAQGLAEGVSSGDWVAAGLGGAGMALEVLSMVVDPVGTLASYGVSWLIEHVQPLKEALDWLAGDPPVIRSFSQTWANVATEVAGIARDYAAEANTGTAGWRGSAADAYRSHSAQVADAVAGTGALAEGISAGVMIMGEVVAFVRETVRDIVGELIGRLIAWALEAVASLGFATPVIVGQAVTAISRVATRIADLIRKLIKTIGNVAPRIGKIVGKLDEIMAKLAKLMRKGDAPGGTTSPSGATTPSGHTGPPGTPRGPEGTTSPSSADGPSTQTSGTNQPTTRDGADTPGSTTASSAPGDGAPGHSPGTPDRPATGDSRSGSSREGDGGGQRSEGNDGCDGKGGDPVDVVSGQMITSKVDLALPGLLPLVLRRAYASDYRQGRLHGPGWSSTLDQRLEVDQDGVRYLGDDAQVLSYPVPEEQAVLPEHGARWPLTHDADTDTYRVKDPESGWVRHFGPAPDDGGVRPITALTDRDGHEVAYLRDPAGLPLAVRHSGGYYVAVDIAQGELGPRVSELRLIDRQGHGVTVVSYRYDARGRMTGVVNSSGLPYRYLHDHEDRITAWIDRNDFRYDYEYRPDGRVARGYSRDGWLDATFDYDLPARVTTVVNSLGHATRYHYDAHNHLTRVVDPLGGEEITEYDRYHRLLSRTDALGNTTRYVRDDAGEVVRIEHPDDTVTSVEYDRRWRTPTRLVHPGGVQWLHTYSDTGAVLTTTDPVGAVTTSELDARGHLAATVAPDGARTTFTSDDTGRPTSATTPDGATTGYQHDGFGRLVSTTGPDGATTRYGWTAEGRLAWQVGADGARQDLSYDAEGNLLSSRSGDGATTVFEVGPFNLPVARTGADGTRYTFAYDTELRLIRVTDPIGSTWDYEYDPAGRLVRESDFTGREVTYRHDAAGRQVGRAETGGAALELERDPRGRILLQRVEGERPVRFDYTPAGHLRRADDGVTEVLYERDALGRPVLEATDGRAVRSRYDALGRRVHRVTPSGVQTTSQYGHTRQQTALVGTAGALHFDHDPAGREITRRLGPRAALTQTYDATGRLTGQNVWAHPSPDPAAPDVPAHQYVPVQQRTYRYRADGLTTAVGDRLRGDRLYELTPAGRVAAVTGATWREQYAYDALGNLAHTLPAAPSDTGGPRVLEGLLLRGAGRSSYDYDQAGRLIRQTRRTLSGQLRVWTYRWNGHGQLVEATTPDGAHWRYLYDPFGRRVAKRRLDEHGAVLEETVFTWDGAELAEQRHTHAGRVHATAWDYRGGTGEPLAQTSRSWLADAPGEVVDSRFHAIVSDLVGTPTELIGADGRVSWYRTESLWGEELGVHSREGVDCPLRFPGQYHDRETGLHYNFHRYYDPATARYLSPDPVGLRPSANHYTYVVNPLVVCDPFGLAGYRGPNGRYAPDPNAPPRTGHDRASEYPHSYWDSTHDTMATNWTREGQALGARPVDASGVPIPRDQLTWVDAGGNVIPFEDLTYDHNPAVVQHWNQEGYDQNRAQREAWYNQPDDMEAMTRSENSRRGALLTERYSDTPPGPNYSCT